MTLAQLAREAGIDNLEHLVANVPHIARAQIAVHHVARMEGVQPGSDTKGQLAHVRPGPLGLEEIINEVVTG